MQWLQDFKRMEPISRIIIIALFCSILLFSFCFQLSSALRDGLQTRLFTMLDKQNPVVYTISWDYDYSSPQPEYLSVEDREHIEKINHVSAAALVSLDSSFVYYPDEPITVNNLLQEIGSNEEPSRWLRSKGAYVEPSFFSLFEYPSFEGRLPIDTDQNLAILGIELAKRAHWQVGATLDDIYAAYGFNYSVSGSPGYVTEMIKKFQPDPLIPLEEYNGRSILGSLVYRRDEDFLTKYDLYTYFDYGTEEDQAKRVAQLPKRSPTIYVTWQEYTDLYNQRKEHEYDYEAWTFVNGEGLYETKTVQEYLAKKWELYNAVPDYSSIKEIGYGFEKPYNYLFVRIDKAENAENTIATILNYLQPIYGDKVKALPTESGSRGVVAMTEESVVPLKKVSYSLAAVSLLLMLSLVTMHGLQERKAIAMKRSIGATETEIELEYFLRYLRLSVPANILSVILVFFFLNLVQSQFNIISYLSPASIVLPLPFTVLLGPTCSFLPLYFLLQYEPMAALSDEKGMRWWIFDIRRELVWFTFLVVVGVVAYGSLTALKDMNVVNDEINKAGFDRLTLETVVNVGQNNLPPVYLRVLENMGLETQGLAWQGTITHSNFIHNENKYVTDIVICEGDSLTAQGLHITEGHWLSSNQETVLGNSLAEGLFGSAQAALGQSIRFSTDGAEYEIVGVVTPQKGIERPNLENAEAAVYLSTTAQDAALWQDVLKPIVILRSNDFDLISRSRATLEQWLSASENPLLRIKEKLYDLEQSRQLQQTFLYTVWMFIILEVVQIGLAVLAFTLIRTRELARRVAIQRALGATQSQIARVIFTESIWPAFPAVLIGYILGFILFVSEQGLSYIYFTDHLITLIPIFVSLILCVLATWQPAQRFAKVPPANLF